MGQIMRNLLLLFFCWSSQGRPQIGETNPQQQSIVSLQSGQQQFTNRLLKQIESNTTTNFVLSPHSIHPVFSQLLQGSGGETKAELESLLGVTASDSLVEQYRILGQGLSGEGFKQANLLAVANSFKPKREYRTSLNNGFQSDIREFDFASNSLGSVQEINRYVEEVTNEKIKDLLADDDVDGLTRMVLINAVYFKANWQFAFNAEETFESSFNSPEGSVSTQYMSRESVSSSQTGLSFLLSTTLPTRSPYLPAKWSTQTMIMGSRRELLSSKSQPVQRWRHPAQTLRFAAKCSGTSPTRWTTQSSVTKLHPKARNLTGYVRTGLFARRAKTSSITSCQSLVGLSGATLLLPSWQTGPQKQTQVESGVVKVSRAELNPFKQRGGAKLSRTSLKLPSSFNAETEPKPLCVMYYLSLLKI